MLYQGIPWYFYECRTFNFTDEANIRAIISARSNGNKIFIFDGYDEIRPEIRPVFDDLIIELDEIHACNVTVIISSRYNPARSRFDSVFIKAIESYKVFNICAFSDEQLNAFVDSQIPRDSGYYSLLKNTMFLYLLTTV